METSEPSSGIVAGRFEYMVQNFHVQPSMSLNIVGHVFWESFEPSTLKFGFKRRLQRIRVNSQYLCGSSEGKAFIMALKTPSGS